MIFFQVCEELAHQGYNETAYKQLNLHFRSEPSL